MRKKINQGKRQQNKFRTRLLIVVAVSSIVIAATGCLLVILNLNNLSKTKASGTETEGGGKDLGNGEVISEFTWEKDPVTLATLGPDGIKSSHDAHSMAGGRNSTNGLSPGKRGKNIDLEIKSEEIFNQDGIDISIDFRRNEPDGDFISRGNNFNFGMEDGYLAINFCIENKLGKIESIKEKTQYEIPIDPVFRNYRFLYTASTGKAEIFVNNLIIWQKETEKNTALSWKKSDDIIIGRNMNGGGSDIAIFDNLIIKSSGSISPLAESLLNFILETKDGGVKIQWATSENDKVNYFTIQKSINGTDFTNLVNVPPLSDTEASDDYVYLDKSPVTAAVVYYRLRQTFKNGKFVTHALSAIRFRSDKSFAIENLSPIQFQNACDINYYLPKSGRVWLQVTNEQGKVLSTENFEASEGKNVHIFKDEKNLDAGTYNLSLIFENKKSTTKLVKIKQM